MAGGELRLGTTSMYMTTYITRFGTSLHINTNLHGYILSDKCKLIAQNQAFERVNRGKFSLEGLAVSRGDRMTSWPYSQSCRTASIRSGRAGGLAGEVKLGSSGSPSVLRTSEARWGPALAGHGSCRVVPRTGRPVFLPPARGPVCSEPGR